MHESVQGERNTDLSLKSQESGRDNRTVATKPTNGISANGVSADKQALIIERAIIMFNEIGYERVRVSDITDSLGIGKGTFYLYFQNKKDLLLACFERMGELVLDLESIARERGGSFFERVGPRVEAVHHYDWFPGLINLLRAGENSPDQEIKTKARDAYETIAYPLKCDLEVAISEGLAREVDAELAAFGFIGMAENVYFRSRFDDNYTPEEVVAFMEDATTRWLSTGVSPEDNKSRGLEKAVSLTGRDGTRFELVNVTFNGRAHLCALLGPAEIDVNPSGVARLTVEEAGESWFTDLTMTDGSEMQLTIDPETVVSGEARFGTVRITLRDVASLAPSEF